jgi:hypothetical protein
MIRKNKEEFLKECNQIHGKKYDYSKVDYRRVNRIKYQKHKLVNEGFDKNKTAHQICLERGLFTIYDCGHKIFTKYVI